VIADPVVYRLEERLREPVDGHVQKTARPTSTGVRGDEQRVHRPARETVDEKPALTEAERAEFKAERERMLANAARTRELAERAQAKLDAKSSQR
jgi:hypothetical protein